MSTPAKTKPVDFTRLVVTLKAYPFKAAPNAKTALSVEIGDGDATVVVSAPTVSLLNIANSLQRFGLSSAQTVCEPTFIPHVSVPRAVKPKKRTVSKKAKKVK